MQKYVLKKGMVQSATCIGSTFEKDIKELDPRKANKQRTVHDIKHKNEKEKMKKEYLRRLRLFLGIELSAKNKIQATASLAVPILRSSFGIINWCQEELQKPNKTS